MTSNQIKRDETRDFGMEYLDDMKAMVRQHRNHPSVVSWSLCNEYECQQYDHGTGANFSAATKQLDRLSGRAVAANSKANIVGLSGLDVLGYSHAGVAQFAAAHNASPTTPLVLSECCSCQSQREVGSSSSDGGSDGNLVNGNIAGRSVNSECIATSNSPGFLPYMSGSLGVWTGFDYYVRTALSRRLLFKSRSFVDGDTSIP